MVDLPFRIRATDDASGITASTQRKIKRSLADIDDSFDDTASNAKRALDIINGDLDETEQEMRDVARVSDLLKAALGDSFDGSTGSIDQFVTKLRGAGLTINDIEGEVDGFAASLQRAEDVARSSSQRIGDEFDRNVRPSVERTSAAVDRSGSVFANFAGNAAQDLPGISGAFGALNVAAGQFVEYASEGGIAIKGLVAALGPIAVGTLLVSKIASAFAASSEAARRHREQVDGLVDSIRDGEDASAALLEQWEDLGKVEVRDPLGNTLNLNDDLRALGLTAEDFQRIVEGGGESIGAWGQAARDAGLDAGAVDRVLQGMVTTYGTLEEAEEGARVQSELFGDAQGEVRRALERVTAATEAAAEASEEHAEAQEAAAEAVAAVEEAIDEAKSALDEWAGAVEDVAGLEVDMSEAMLDSADQLDDYREVMEDAEATDRDKIRASNDLISAFEAEGETARLLAETQARAAGRSATAVEEGVAAQIATLTRLAQNMEPGSPVRLQTEAMIANLQLIEGTHHATVTVDTKRALEDLERVRALIAVIQANVAVAVARAGTSTSGPGPTKSLAPMVVNNIYGATADQVAELERATLFALNTAS